VPDPLVISIDAMGGDHGPSVVVPGVARAIALLAGQNVRFLLHGDETAITHAMSRLPAVQACCEIRPAERVIANDEKPARAMRRGKGSSMWNAIESVQSGEAHAAVSSGNTGALMAISMLQLRMIGEMERPALVASWPTSRGITAVLDVGANIDCDAERLVEFAILGAAFHRAVHHSQHPTVGVLNVGSEDEKGHEEVKGANRLLRATQFDMDYRGFVEGDDIAKGSVDVIVTDGFTGNVALKTAEGLARFFTSELRAAFTGSLLGKIGAFIAQGALRKMRERMDPGGGGPFLGLNGIVVKSHGGADARGFAAAISLAAELAKSDFAAEIDRNLKRLTAVAEAGATGGEGTDGAQTPAAASGHNESGERSNA
jgi:glycerol-3-phosphate acyltransferase PlsX